PGGSRWRPEKIRQAAATDRCPAAEDGDGHGGGSPRRARSGDEPVGEEALGACGNSRGGAAADGPEAPDPRAPAAPGPPDHRGFPLWGPGREPGGSGEGGADAVVARLPIGDPATARRCI